MDTDLSGFDKRDAGYYHVVTGCLSRGRQPRVIASSNVMSCDNHASTLKVANLQLETLKVIPFPEPGNWYVGFQLSCRNASRGNLIPCPKSSISTMISVEVSIQPCDYRPLRESCGGRGVCTTNHKGAWSFSSCSCNIFGAVFNFSSFFNHAL